MVAASNIYTAIYIHPLTCLVYFVLHFYNCNIDGDYYSRYFRWFLRSLFNVPERTYLRLQMIIQPLQVSVLKTEFDNKFQFHLLGCLPIMTYMDMIQLDGWSAQQLPEADMNVSVLQISPSAATGMKRYSAERKSGEKHVVFAKTSFFPSQHPVPRNCQIMTLGLVSDALCGTIGVAHPGRRSS